jgi:hypothetical protein
LGFNYQEREVWDSIIKRGRFGIQLSRAGGLGSSYQEREDWDPVIKRGGFGIQLSREGGLGSSYQEREVWGSSYQEREVWHPINWFNPATFSYLWQTGTCISKVIYFYVQ